MSFTLREIDRMLLRELRQSGGMLVAIVLISAVGVMSFVSMLTTYRNLEQSRAGYYARCRMADFWIDLKKAPLAEVERLREVAGVADLRTRIQFSVLVDIAEAPKPVSGLVLTMPETRQPVINNFVLRQGGYFSTTRREEVIVSEDFAEARRLSPGDCLSIIVNRRRLDLLIVGTAITSEYVYLVPPGGLVPEKDRYGVFWIKRRYAEEIFDFDGACNQVVGVLDPVVRSHPEAVLVELERRLDDFGVFSTTKLADQFSNLSLSGEMDGLKVTAYFLPILFLGVAAIVLNTQITSAAERQRTVMGTLKALGYGSGTVFAYYLKLAAIIAAVACALGCATGYYLAGLSTDLYRAQFFKFPDLVNRFYPDVMLLAVLISLLFAGSGAWRGARRLVRLAPAEAMRPAAPKAGHRVVLERLTAIWSRLGFVWQTVLRNLLRDRGRSLTSLCASALGASLMVIAFYQAGAATFLVEFQFDRVLLSDHTLVLKDECDGGALLEARRLPGVDYAESTFNVACTLRNGPYQRKTAIEGIKPDAVLTVPCGKDGRRVPVPPRGLLLTPRLAGKLDVTVGDKLQLIPVKGVKEPRQVAVAGIVDSYLGLVAYADYDWLNQLVGEADAISAVHLRTATGLEHSLALNRAVKEMPAVETVRSTRENRQMLDELMLGSMWFMLGIITVFAGLIYFGSILNSSLISLNERRREIATYRVLGYTPVEVGRIFLRESLIVNLLGALVGLWLGYTLSMAYADSFEFDTWQFPKVVAPSTFIWAWLLALGFTLLAHLPVQRALNRLDWLAALNVQE